MILADQWPQNMEYVSCDSYTDGSDTPSRTLDLKSFFVKVTQPTTFGTFSLKSKGEFNGHSHLKFDMDILGVRVRNGIECTEKNLGNWTAGFSTPFYMDAMNGTDEFNVKKVYRVSTVVVKQLFHITKL